MCWSVQPFTAPEVHDLFLGIIVGDRNDEGSEANRERMVGFATIVRRVLEWQGQFAAQAFRFYDESQCLCGKHESWLEFVMRTPGEYELLLEELTKLLEDASCAADRNMSPSWRGHCDWSGLTIMCICRVYQAARRKEFLSLPRIWSRVIHAVVAPENGNAERQDPPMVREAVKELLASFEPNDSTVINILRAWQPNAIYDLRPTLERLGYRLSS